MKYYVYGLICFLLIGCSISNEANKITNTGRGSVQSYTELPELSCSGVGAPSMSTNLFMTRLALMGKQQFRHPQPF